MIILKVKDSEVILMEFMEYITENALILIPALYVIGMFLKALEFIKDKYI